MKKMVLVALLGVMLPVMAEAQGRWKAGGYGECYWDPNDGGPNQCDPNQPPPAVEEEATDEELAIAEHVGLASEALVNRGFTDPARITEWNIPEIVEVLEQHGLWQGELSSAQARELLWEGVRARQRGDLPINGYAVPRQVNWFGRAPTITLRPVQLQFNPNDPRQYVPRAPGTPLEDCWVMKEKSKALGKLAAGLAASTFFWNYADKILGISIPKEVTRGGKTVPMLARFATPIAVASFITGAAGMVTGWMSAQYAWAPCQAGGNESWSSKPFTIRAAHVPTTGGGSLPFRQVSSGLAPALSH